MFVLTLNAMHIAMIHMVINEILKYMKPKNSMKIVKRKSKCIDQKGNVRKIYINPQWEYFKRKVKTNLSNTEKNKIYRRRKYEIEPIFGNLKAYLGFTRFTVRSKKKGKSTNGDSVNGIGHVENVH